MSAKVRVGVRVRPLHGEAETNDACRVRGHQISAGGTTGNFDWVWDRDKSTLDVYRDAAPSLVENLFKGYNTTILAYGQTGSGKTWTMSGYQDNKGIVAHAIDDIFEKIAELQSDGTTVAMSVSYMEIYKEEIYDLLSESAERERLNIREINGETVVEDIGHRDVSTRADIISIIGEASARRRVAATRMNDSSSRSHALLTISLKIMAPREAESCNADNPTSYSVLCSKMHLVDLAGSERQSKTQTSGDSLREGISINKGLLALGNVVSALQQSSQQAPGGRQHIHVPYRDSKLTRILKDSLGGNSYTVMLACVSPAAFNADETASTINFARRAAAVVNSARVNYDLTTSSSSDNVSLLRELEFLRQTVCDLKCRNEFLTATHSQVQALAPSLPRMSELELLSCFTKMAGLVRGLLVRCMEEAVEINDAEADLLLEDIMHVRRTAINAPPPVVVEAVPLPAIFRLVEALQRFEGELLALCQGDEQSAAASSDSSMENSSLTLSSDAGSADSSMADDESVVALRREAVMREGELSAISSQASEQRSLIDKLQCEIKALEKEKNILDIRKARASIQPVGFGGSSSSSDDRYLKVKKLLHEKTQALRSREAEHGRLEVQRESAAREIASLRREIESSKAQKVELKKKMKEDSKRNRDEKSSLLQSVADMVRKERMAQEATKALESAFGRRERVMQSRLASQERESAHLRQLLEKRGAAQQDREAAKRQRTNSGAPAPSSSSGMPPPAAGSSCSLPRGRELREWIDGEVDKVIACSNARSEIAQLSERKAQLIAELAALRHAQEGGLAHRSLEASRREKEEESRKITLQIAERQRRMGAQSDDKRRFNHINSLQEAKLLLGVLFAKSTSAVFTGQAARLSSSSLPSSEQSVIEDDGDEAEVDFDETFYPSEEEEEDESGSDSSSAGRRRAPARGRKRACEEASEAAACSSDKEEESDEETPRPKKKKKALVGAFYRFVSHFNLSESDAQYLCVKFQLSKPLADHTVSELKPLLKEHRLPVTGTKAALISRLEKWYVDNLRVIQNKAPIAMPVNNENSGAAAGNAAITPAVVSIFVDE